MFPEVTQPMLYRFLSSDYPITLALLVVLLAWTRWQRAIVFEMVRLPSRRWRRVGWAAIAATLLLVVWVALFDNWRQLLGLFLPAGQRWMSDPFETAPTPWFFRMITLVLVTVSVGGSALIYAYHRGGLLLPLALVVPARAYVYFLDSIRQRTDVLLRMAEGKLEGARLIDIVGTLYWTVGVSALIGSIVLASWLFLWGLAVPMARVLLWIATRRQETPTSPRFALYRRRADAMRRAAGVSRPKVSPESTPPSSKA
jgi:hypothetical protein